MAKYSKKMVDTIVGLIKADTFTIAEICAKVGINACTFHEWMNTHPDFAQSVENARNAQMENMVMIAKKSLRKKLEGYTVEETTVVTIPSGQRDANGNQKPKIKEQKTTKKHIAADTTAIIFTLTNGDPEHWRNRQSTEVTGKDGKDLFNSLSDEELDKKIEELKRKLN